MTDDRRGRKKVAGPLLLSTLAHIALLVPLSIPGCSISQQSEDQPERPKEPDALTVDLLDEPPSQQSKPPRLKGEICDPNAPAEYHYFDIKPGPARDRIYHAARPHYGDIIMATDSLAGKRSRALRGWFRPFDAVRLLAGDAGLCTIDLRKGIGINYCHRSDAPFSRANEAWARREWKLRDCTDAKPARLQKPAVV
ncbi:hypothetical protein [Sphingopyxis sp. SCN 67-31]|uniref:hypothetical protein n=1 Tax=Sphingopyxis sp. SCN 67-31 TaxID=1660142 RepID=UPI000869EF78|nr:hypothetical protein [Sphingopyxis sp. SCN 67-31]ODU30010.1 MAG: hypothetical protein ABS88_06545 [Sphingopyxis sp. SCN 67-31]